MAGSQRGYKSEKITFEGDGGHALAGILDWPLDGAVEATAVFCHCFTCSKDVKAAARVAQRLAEHGIATLRFDFTGLGESEGEFHESDFSRNIADIKAAVADMTERFAAPRLLIGHSLGGAAVLAAAGEIDCVAAVVTIGAPSGPAHVKHLFRDALDAIRDKGQGDITIAGRSFCVTGGFLDDIEDHVLEDKIAHLHKALMVMHAPLDSVVGVENAAAIFQHAKHPKSFVSLDDADHMLTRAEHAHYAADIIHAWATRYIGAGAPPAKREASLPHGCVEVAEAGTGPYANVVRVGRHILRADEPETVDGGTDTGPSPYDYLLGALGACTSMTIRMYAEHKGFALDKVSVRLKHQKVHAEDCKDCDSTSGKIDVIERTVFVEGDFDDKTRDRLLLVADKCPVHKTLNSEIKVRTRLAAGDEDEMESETGS